MLADALYEDVKRYVKREDVFVCPNAIPAISNANQVNENSDHVPHILWLTNIMKTKGIMEYLSALKILKDKGVKFQADFVGGLTKEMSGEEFDYALSMMGLNGCCTYYGPKYGDDKYSFSVRLMCLYYLLIPRLSLYLYSKPCSLLCLLWQATLVV